VRVLFLAGLVFRHTDGGQVSAKVFLIPKGLRKPAAFVHKAVKTAFLSSQPKRGFFRRGLTLIPMAQVYAEKYSHGYLLPKAQGHKLTRIF